MLELIARRHGTALALDVAALFLYGGGTAHHRDPHAGPAAAHAQGGRCTDAAQPRGSIVRSAAIAGSLGLSQRKLEMLFRTHADLTAVQLYRRIRSGGGREGAVLETTQSIAEIAGRCGYGDPAAMTRAFRAEFGVTPRNASTGRET